MKKTTMTASVRSLRVALISNFPRNVILFLIHCLGELKFQRGRQFQRLLLRLSIMINQGSHVRI